jgi:hypothetical protein
VGRPVCPRGPLSSHSRLASGTVKEKETASRRVRRAIEIASPGEPEHTSQTISIAFLTGNHYEITPDVHAAMAPNMETKAQGVQL